MNSSKKTRGDLIFEELLEDVDNSLERQFDWRFVDNNYLEGLKKDVTEFLQEINYDCGALIDRYYLQLKTKLEHQHAFGISMSMAHHIIASKCYSQDDMHSAWVCLFEAKYWLGMIECEGINSLQEKKLGLLRDASSKGGVSKSKKYEPLRELIKKSIIEDRPSHGWRSISQFARMFVETHAKEKVVKDLYDDNHHKLEKSIIKNHLSKSKKNLRRLFEENKFKDI